MGASSEQDRPGRQGPAASDAPTDPAPTDDVDDVLAEVAMGIGWARSGDREGARLLFAALWRRVGDSPDALHRCAVAHSMADVVDDPQAELRWDLRALAAADQLQDERLQRAGMGLSVDGLFPSLHLNLGDVYRRLGHHEHAVAHLHAARRALAGLPLDDYRRSIDEGLQRLDLELRRATQG